MSGVMRSGSDSSRVIPLLPWRLRNCATMTALCRIVLLTRFWRTRQTDLFREAATSWIAFGSCADDHFSISGW